MFIYLLYCFPYDLSLTEFLMIRYLATPYEHEDLAQLTSCATFISTIFLECLRKTAGIEVDLCTVLLSNCNESTEGHISLREFFNR